MATLSVVITALGRRAVVAYLVGVVGVALVFGVLTDALVAHWALDISAQISVSEHMLPHSVHWVATAFGWLNVPCWCSESSTLNYHVKNSCV